MFLKKVIPTAHLIIVLSGTLLLGSCLDLNTEIKISGNGKVKATIEYSLDGSIADFGRGFVSDDPWPFPLSEIDFEQKALKVDGAELIRYRTRTDEDGEIVMAVVRAESLASMSSFLNIPMILNKNSGTGNLTLSFPRSGDYAGKSAETRELIDKLAAGATIRFSIRPPSKPVNGGVGTIDGRSVTLELSLLDLLYDRAPESWIITW